MAVAKGAVDGFIRINIKVTITKAEMSDSWRDNYYYYRVDYLWSNDGGDGKDQYIKYSTSTVTQWWPPPVSCHGAWTSDCGALEKKGEWSRKSERGIDGNKALLFLLHPRTPTAPYYIVQTALQQQLYNNTCVGRTLLTAEWLNPRADKRTIIVYWITPVTTF